MTFLYRILMALFLILLTGGCLKMGPDYQRPDIKVGVPSSFRHAPVDSTLSLPLQKWWEAFHDPELNAIVERVVRNNLDIQKATAAIRIAQAQYAQSRAGRFPSIGAQGDRQQQTQWVTKPAPGLAGLMAGETIREKQTTDVYGFSLPAAFELDFWGRLARSQEAAGAAILRTEESRTTVAQTVIAETVSLYLQMESIERQLANTFDSIETYTRSSKIVEGRYKRGLTSILDLKQARRLLAGAEARLPDLHLELGKIQHQLAVLQGFYPRSQTLRTHPSDYFQRLETVPAGLPSELLQRRPDIRMAEAQLMELNAQIGVAKANRFPSIKLTGSYGYSSNELDLLFDPYSKIYSWAVAVSQSLFDAGRLKAGQRAAEAAYQQGVAHYIQTVLTAFSEVENALLTRKAQLARRDKLLIFLKEARATQEIADNRYKRGLTNYLTVLDAMQTRFAAEENLILVELAIMANRVTLHRALGGGWDRLTPVEDRSGYILTSIPIVPGDSF